MLGVTICGPLGPQVSKRGIGPLQKASKSDKTVNLSCLYAYISFDASNNME